MTATSSSRDTSTTETFSEEAALFLYFLDISGIIRLIDRQNSEGKRIMKTTRTIAKLLKDINFVDPYTGKAGVAKKGRRFEVSNKLVGNLVLLQGDKVLSHFWTAEKGDYELFVEETTITKTTTRKAL